jgi:hypothetical protein
MEVKMVEKYGVVFSRDEEYKGYVAEAVGLPGCFSQGKTMEEAIENIKHPCSLFFFLLCLRMHSLTSYSIFSSRPFAFFAAIFIVGKKCFRNKKKYGPLLTLQLKRSTIAKALLSLIRRNV